MKNLTILTLAFLMSFSLFAKEGENELIESENTVLETVDYSLMDADASQMDTWDRFAMDMASGDDDCTEDDELVDITPFHRDESTSGAFPGHFYPDVDTYVKFTTNIKYHKKTGALCEFDISGTTAKTFDKAWSHSDYEYTTTPDDKIISYKNYIPGEYTADGSLNYDVFKEEKVEGEAHAGDDDIGISIKTKPILDVSPCEVYFDLTFEEETPGSYNINFSSHECL